MLQVSEEPAALEPTMVWWAVPGLALPSPAQSYRSGTNIVEHYIFLKMRYK